MSSTRLNNSPGEYCLQQYGYNHASAFELYKYKCIAYESAMPGLGVNMPMMTNGYNNGILSKNASDIESALFGIGSTNLVENRAPVEAKINCMGTAKFFAKPDLIIPEPLVIEKNQRPKGPFC